MNAKMTGVCLFMAVVVALGVGTANGGLVAGERALTASELTGTTGACCSSDYIDSQACSTTNNWNCLSCITGPALCGIAREYSGNVIQQCLDGDKGVCTFTINVDCYRNIPCTQSEPSLKTCPSSGSSCSWSTTTDCVICTVGTPGPWITTQSFICAK